MQMRITKNRIERILVLEMVLILLTGCSLFPDEAPIDDTIRVAHYTPAEHVMAKVQYGNLEYSDIATLYYVNQTSKDYYIKFQPDYSQWDLGLKCYVVVGDFVKKGQLLVEAPSEELEKTISEYEKQISSLEMDISYNQELLELADSEAERQGYENSIADLKEQIQVLKLRIEETTQKLASYRIYADMDGQVSYIVNWEMGYNTDSTFLTVTSLEGYFEGELDETLVTFKEGDTVTVEVAGKSMEMVVKYIGSNPDAEGMEESGEEVIEETEDAADEEGMDTSPGIVFVRLTTDGTFESKQRARLVLADRKLENVLYIPAGAVSMEEDKAYVRVLAEDGYIRVKEIRVSEMINDYYVVESGLKEGEEIVNE